MRYIDADEIILKLKALQGETLYEKNYNFFNHAIQIVNESKTLKDPLGINYGSTLNALLGINDDLIKHIDKLEAEIYRYREGNDNSDYINLYRINQILMNDNRILRMSYRELKEEMMKLEEKINAGD